jgi:hypothetical protein
VANLDALADFLIARMNESGTNQIDRSKIIGLIAAYRGGVAPAETESAMRVTALAFKDHPVYREDGDREVNHEPPRL